MSSIIKKILLVSIVLCQGVMAQTSEPGRPLDLKITATPAGTMYLDGNRPIAKMTTRGLTGYIYDHGRMVLAVRADGRYAAFKYANGKLDHIEYSDGTVRRLGDSLAPSAGGSIAARGGSVAMAYDDGWEDYWADHNSGINDGDDGNVGIGVGGFDGGGGGGGGDGFPRDARPNNPFDRIACLAAAMRTLEVAFTEVCPMMKNQAVCIFQAMLLHDEALAFCMSRK